MTSLKDLLWVIHVEPGEFPMEEVGGYFEDMLTEHFHNRGNNIFQMKRRLAIATKETRSFIKSTSRMDVEAWRRYTRLKRVKAAAGELIEKMTDIERIVDRKLEEDMAIKEVRDYATAAANAWRRFIDESWLKEEEPWQLVQLAKVKRARKPLETKAEQARRKLEAYIEKQYSS